MKFRQAPPVSSEILVLLFSLVFCLRAGAQNEYLDKNFQILFFEKAPIWAAVATDWDQASPQIHLFDPVKYKGHAQYVSVGLKTGITFKQFKARTNQPENRQYVPFVLFDLRDSPVEVEGEKYLWAIRLVDYEYKDEVNSMEQTVIRLLKTVEAYIARQSRKKPSKGILVLATNPQSTPNTSIAPAVNAEGYPNMTHSALLSKIGGKKVEVLNEGKGIGYLRYIKSGEEDNYRPSAEDILIYESLPKRVPPVSGIITLEPQTPLSHINLLAKNRGTFNLYALDLNALPSIKTHLNQLVRIDCSEKEITLSTATENEAKKYWDSRMTKVEIPKPILSQEMIIPLEGKRADIHTQTIGAKAANYGLIRQHKPEYVKPGFGVPFTHYFEVIRSCGADTLIRNLSKMDREEAGTTLSLIRKRIKGAQVNPELIAAIRKTQNESYGGARIRLRSSTNCEDLPEFNGAGLYTSKGFNAEDSDEKLAKKILQVYASLWSELAFDERAHYLIDHERAGMAILINPAFSDEFANGVALTLPEMDLTKVGVFINSQMGENSVTNPKNGELPESIFFRAGRGDKYELRSRSNIQDVFTSEELRELLPELRKLTLFFHELFVNEDGQIEGEEAYGVDIEFKVMQEAGEFRLYVKQARLLRSVMPE